MSFDIQTFVLGLVQGICEFLPISSSGHLALLQHFFGFGDLGENLVAFDLLLHCATVLVILIYFRAKIFRVICDWLCGWFSQEKRKSWGWAYAWQIIIATFMTGLIGLPLRKIVDAMSDSPLAVGCGLIFTAIVLSFLPVSSSRPRSKSLFAIALAVGFAQGLAVLPGVSRSGMTIAAGIFMGLGLTEAFEFSFLISVPAVLGASLLEFLKLLKNPDAIFLPDGYVWACVIAFVAGFAALNIMRRLVLLGKWAYFGLYCLVIGAAAILFSLEIF